MKILFVSNLYGELARGGAERIVEREASALAAAGHDIVVVTAERPREIPKGVCLPAEPWRCPPPGDAAAVQAAYDAAVARQKKPGQPRVVRFDPGNIYFYADDHAHGIVERFFWHMLDMTDAKSAKTFDAILGLEKPDVVHTHNLMGLGFRIPAVIRRRRIRHVHTVHDVQLLHPSGLLASSGDRPWYALVPQAAYVAWMRALMGSPDTVIFPSHFLRALHDRAGFFRRSKKMILVNPTPAVVATRIAPASLRFLFVGQVETHKGVGLLLDAWEKSGLGAAGAALEIVGAGSAADAMKKKAAPIAGISFSGQLSGTALAAAYDRASFVVVPSLVIENQPTVILEAFSRGTPVVAAMSGGIPEIVREGETGFLFMPGDVDACCDTLKRAAAHPEWLHLSQTGRAWAATHGIAAHVDGLLRAYRT
jgi:glycosyltransferase involved in cell wall biosynthesis